MGSHISCISNDMSRGTATVVDGADGGVRRIETPVTAAEVMLDAPGCALASADHVRRTKRSTALPADEELRPGSVYFLFPAAKKGSRVSDEKVAVLESALRRRRGRGKAGARGSKVFPAAAAAAAKEARANWCQIGGGRGFPCCSQIGGVHGRQWKPVLNTIDE